VWVKKLKLNIDTKIELNNGIKIPIIGLGTWALNGKVAYNAVSWALELGYRLIDTAMIYENERSIGNAIKDCEISREEIFITTKVWKSDQGYNKTLQAIDRSLKNLNIEYVDLYLIHWPVPGKTLDTWKALEKIYSQGKARSIGVSNYNFHFLNQLMNNADVIPVINQVEFSPFLYQKDLLDYCNSKKIYIEAYTPLTRGERFDHPTIVKLAKKHNKTAAQILIRWGLQHNIIEIPKSGNKSHLKENINVFDFNLDDNDMRELDILNEDLRQVDDPVLYVG
jgi:diketogulonate reductase-like aldo/keto reductase